MADDYNFYVFCYVKEYLDFHMEKARNGIRFINSDYKELFRIQDGEKIKITRPDGESQIQTCRYIDECHVEIGNSWSSLYHICQFAERMENERESGNPHALVFAGMVLQHASVYRRTDYYSKG